MPLEANDSHRIKTWTLFVPEENCEPGLEVHVTATSTGLTVGDGEISWANLEHARKMAGGSITK